jgi:2-polyprenyl-3-methyl-5-hydroxy-6-metoxy-1,4-benzoquinol methylase
MDRCACCDNEGLRSRRLLPDFSVSACPECGLLVNDEGPPAQRLADDEIDAASYRQGVEALRRRQAVDLLDAVRPLAEQKGTWLDVGCRFGHLLEIVRADGFPVRGLEPDEDHAGAAEARLGPEIVSTETIAEAALARQSVEVISMLDVLEHIPLAELPGTGDALHAALRPGGLLVLKVPSSEGLFFQVCHAAAKIAPALAANFLERLWQRRYAYPHRLYFNESSLKQFAARHSFRVLSVQYYNEVPLDTVIARVRMDSSIPRWQAPFLVPAAALINVAQALLRKTDALVLIARRV